MSNVDHDRKIVWVDYSGLASFQACKEQARLGIVEGWRLKQTKASLAFGHAIHAALAAYYDALAGGRFVVTNDKRVWVPFPPGQFPSALKEAQKAFLRDLQLEGNELPVSLDSDEKRSVERGLALVEAYIVRWKDEPYDNILDSSGAPMTEVPFQYDLMEYQGYRIVYIGTIDRLMMNRAVARPVIFESKTTGSALSIFVKQAKPNGQVTGYFPKAKLLFPDLKECVWDCIFVSSRKPDLDKAKTEATRFWMYGVDIEKDFARQTTSRTDTDIKEFIWDAQQWTEEYCQWLFSDAQRWPRSAPQACHRYDGCAFRDVCSINSGAEHVLNTHFMRRPWEPWKRIQE